MVDQMRIIPEGWERVMLGGVIEFSNGRVRPKNKGKYPVYGGNGILDYADSFNSSGGTVIVGRVGAYCGCVYFEQHELWLSDNAIGIKANEQSNTKFLYYLLSGQNLNKQSIGGAQPLITQGILNEIEILLPPLPEQHAIVGVLSSLDDKIKLLHEQNKTLEATAKVLFKKWFVNFDFPRKDEKPYKSNGGKMIASDLGEIPEGWIVGTVHSFIERNTISYRCIKSDLSKKGKTPIIDQGADGLYGYTEREPDFQASSENPVILFTNHTCNMWFVNYPFCAIQNVIPFRGSSDYSTFFVYYMTLGRTKFIEYKGHWPDFEQKKYVIPPLELANKFAEIVKPLQHKIWSNNSQIQTLATLRDTLLPKLMKGEISVSKL